MGSVAGFYFNGPLKATDFYYLTAHSVTDAVVNDGDATVTSAPGGFTAAMVGRFNNGELTNDAICNVR